MKKQTEMLIKEIQWSFILLDNGAYCSKHGKDSHGITVSDTLTVYFNKKWFSERLVRHELFHAYMASCCINSTNDLSSEDMEEIAAEVYEFHAKTLDIKSKEIYDQLC